MLLYGCFQRPVWNQRYAYVHHICGIAGQFFSEPNAVNAKPSQKNKLSSHYFYFSPGFPGS